MSSPHRTRNVQRLAAVRNHFISVCRKQLDGSQKCVTTARRVEERHDMTAMEQNDSEFSAYGEHAHVDQKFSDFQIISAAGCEAM